MKIVTIAIMMAAIAGAVYNKLAVDSAMNELGEMSKDFYNSIGKDALIFMHKQTAILDRAVTIGLWTTVTLVVLLVFSLIYPSRISSNAKQ